MSIYFLLRCIIVATLLTVSGDIYAQAKKNVDTITTTQKKRRLMTALMKSISRNGDATEPIKIVNPFLKVQGKFVRRITIVPIGFDRSLTDTSKVKKNFAIDVANAFHHNSTDKLIRKNLFFKKGDKILPLLLADNERFLRDQEFIQDALIIIDTATSTRDSIDFVVFAKDVFSIGGSANVSSTKRGSVELKEENFAGSGNKLSGGFFYDAERSPRSGYGVEFIKRNLKGSFINWTTGFKTYLPEINTGRKEETSYYTILEKPLRSRYSTWTGAWEMSYNHTTNNYLQDSAYEYKTNYRYQFGVFDLWAGYNFGAKDRKDRDSDKRLRHLVAVRSFYNNFYTLPYIYKDSFDYKYANINGALISYSLYKQNFYRTNFIYGFGRNEDVPKGLNASIIGGYTNKQGVKRTYMGLEFAGTTLSPTGYFTSYTFRSGGFINKKTVEDVDILLGIDHFTRIREINKNWRNRNFVSLSYTKQLKPKLNEPLFISSMFGLPYYRNGNLQADTRATFKLESVFYNLQKIAGFRVAPFIFSDVSFLKPVNESFIKTKGYSAVGGGFRTRNENLVFGTIEVRGYVFPSPALDMRNWKVEVSTNLKFKYNSTFVKRPEFVVAN